MSHRIPAPCWRSSHGRPVADVQTFAVEFDEFANNALGAQHFDDFQHQVGACGAFDHLACQLKANDFGDQHRNRLAQHRGLGLDPANTPAQNGQAVDHGGVAVCADKRVRVGNLFAVLVCVRPDGLRQILKVHLVADAGARGHNAEVVKRALGPISGTYSAPCCARIRGQRSSGTRAGCRIRRS